MYDFETVTEAREYYRAVVVPALPPAAERNGEYEYASFAGFLSDKTVRELDARRGAMARPFILRRIPINGGGYDSGGAYWGIGAPLYWYYSETTELQTPPYARCEYCGKHDRYGECNSPSGQHEFPTREVEVEISDYIRASDRDHAKAIITAKYPDAKFYR